jgi:hypothetical protein
MPPLNEADYAMQAGNLANAVCGFSIVQTLLLLIAVGPGRGDLAHAVDENRKLALVCIVIGTLL